MRAIQPTQAGHLKLEGFGVYFEEYGDMSAPAVMLLPTWQIAHSRMWKMQIPHLARHFRVVTYDPPGNGGGERTLEPAAYENDRVMDQGIALLDHLGIEQADLIGVSRGCVYGLWMAARYPERVRKLVIFGNGVTPETRYNPDPSFLEPREHYEGWEKANANYWLADYRGWLEFFIPEVHNLPHSTKAIEDGIAWGLETTPEILLQTSGTVNPAVMMEMPIEEVLARIRCPVLILHGDQDAITPLEASEALVEARPDFEMVTLGGCGHTPHGRDPVRFNLLVTEWLAPPRPTRRRWRRATTRHPPRALFVSSPIGLGHVQRDLAIARELRDLVPELEIEWLAQHPVTRVLEAAGESIHPLSALLSNESAHVEAAASDHGLHAFYALRDMDEILLANFMIFLEAVQETAYDLWIGDEAWDVDYYLHENPELKTAPFVFLSDFIGVLPIDRASDSREAFLTADHNAEILEQVERFGRVRDRALYIGDYDDLIPERFGPGLPFIPEWAREHFEAVGYVIPFDPADYADTVALRRRLGHDPERPLVVYAVGGTAVGEPLLRRAIEAWPQIHRARPDARCLVVAGPRIDPASLPRHEGMEVRAYVHDLFEHLAAADLGVVQGGLTTTMELAINRRPFIYFPLENHFEQRYHVAHRLDRYRAGRRLEFSKTTAEQLAEVALETIGADTSQVRRHDPGAARRAATRISELL